MLPTSTTILLIILLLIIELSYQTYLSDKIEDFISSILFGKNNTFFYYLLQILNFSLLIPLFHDHIPLLIKRLPRPEQILTISFIWEEINVFTKCGHVYLREYTSYPQA